MGNCVGSGSKSASRDLKVKPTKKRDVVLKHVSQDGQDGRLIQKLLAEVNVLSSDEGPLRWESMFHGLVPVSLYCIKEGKVYTYRVCATGVDGTSFHTQIHIPGTNLRKTSSCFVQWRDNDKEGGWGINFMTESDAIKFLEGCSPPTLTPTSERLRHTFSTLSLSLPIPEPPSQIVEHKDVHLDAVVLQPRSDEQNPNVVHRTLDISTPTSTVPSSSVASNQTVAQEDEDNCSPLSSISRSFTEHAEEEGDDHSLFEPSSSLQVVPQTFILPDIQEEGEEVESMSLLSQCSEQQEGNSLVQVSPADGDEKIQYRTKLDKQIRRRSFDFARQSFEEAGLDVDETTFDELESTRKKTGDNSLDVTSNTVSDISISFEGKSSPEGPLIDPPFLPVSPPPGPLLSPRYSMLLAELEQNNAIGNTVHEPSNKQRTYALLNRMSTVSIADDEPPPPLPLSQPPGKMISPRHSLLLLQSGSGLQSGGEDAQLDLRNLLSKVATVYDKQKETEIRQKEADSQNDDLVQEEEPLSDELHNSSTSHNNDKLDEDQVLALVPPPVGDFDECPNESQKKSNLKITPSFLRSLEPPKEFTDSGFPDTDENHGMSDHSTSKGNILPPTEDVVLSLGANERIPHHKKDSSTTITSYSEEKQSEYSGSVELKTNASNSSQLSFTYQNQEEDNSSVSTKAGDGEEAQLQMSILSAKDENEPSIRKTGWLEVKAVLASKNRKVAMTSKRKWKKHWAALKGLNLLLYQCDEESSLKEDAHVDLKLDLELCLVHPIHDHVKRDHIFCITTGNGNTYYMQAFLQSEVDDWITTIHCAAAFAMSGQNSRKDSVKLLHEKMKELHKTIDKEKQLRNMTELNLSSATNSTAKTMANNQVLTCSENIEKYSVELYRVRCYISSLQGTELPNPQTLLSSVSKQTKIALGKVGIFSVSALTAMINARHGLVSSTSTASLHHGRQRSLLSRSNSNPKNPRASKSSTSSLRSREISEPMPIIPSKGSTSSFTRIKMQSSNFDSGDQAETTDMEEIVPRKMNIDASVETSEMSLNIVRVGTPNSQHVQLVLRNDMTITDVLTTICEKQKLNPDDHYVRLKITTEEGVFGFLPDGEDYLVDLIYTSVDVCQKFVHTVVLTKEQNQMQQNFGLSLSAEWESNGLDLRTITVARVESGSIAENNQLHVGDEIVLVNDTSVTDVGWSEMQSLIDTASSLSLTVRTCLIDVPVSSSTAVQMMESLICPAPSSNQPELSREKLQQLIVPTPGSDYGGPRLSTDPRSLCDVSNEHLDLLMKDAKEVSKQIRVWKIQQEREDNVPWTREDRLRKSASDLVDTESDYVRYLDILVERYLRPLQSETFIPKDEIEVLCGDIVQLLEVQKLFLTSLKESSNNPKTMVSGITHAFLDNESHFRGYCTFCASLQKAKDLTGQAENQQLMTFLDVRNPHHDSSLNLDSLLSKPIVRISRYPLFLSAILDNTEPECEERKSLEAAIQVMTKVANHINEMQRLCEAYLLLFESILKSSTIIEVRANINVSELTYHGETKWLDPSLEHLTKGWRKGQGPSMLCFVYNTVIIFICLDKKQKRKENKSSREITVTKDDLSFKTLLPCVYCRVHNLPDSDGVSNMWQIQCKPKTAAKGMSFLFRNELPEQKLQLIQWIDRSIKGQQHIYGGLSGSGRSTPTLRTTSSSTTFSPSPTLQTVPKSISLSPLSQ